jgi:hypothetical protein
MTITKTYSENSHLTPTAIVLGRLVNGVYFAWLIQEHRAVRGFQEGDPVRFLTNYTVPDLRGKWGLVTDRAYPVTGGIMLAIRPDGAPEGQNRLAWLHEVALGLYDRRRASRRDMSRGRSNGSIIARLGGFESQRAAIIGARHHWRAWRHLPVRLVPGGQTAWL